MSKKAVVIIHGFGGGVWDNEFLANYLQLDKNFHIYAFTLPGHHKEVITGIKYQDWISYSEKQIEKISKDYRKIYVIGHSMGGVIATHIASKYKRIKKLVLVAPAFEYGNVSQNIKDVPKLFKRTKNEHPENLYKDIFVKLFRLPFPTMLEFQKLLKKYKGSRENIKCPTLIMHGDLDELIPLSSSVHTYDMIKSRKKYLIRIKDVRHLVFQSKRRKIASKYIHKFLKGGVHKWGLKKTSEI